MDIGKLEDSLAVELVTPSMEIISYLYVNGPTKHGVLYKITKYSLSNAQIVLRNLCKIGVLEKVTGKSDRRVRMYDLSPVARVALDECFKIERGFLIIRMEIGKVDRGGDFRLDVKMAADSQAS